MTSFGGGIPSTVIGASLFTQFETIWLILGLAISALIGVVGCWREALSPSGAAGAVLVGALVFGLGGWDWGVVLVGFFVSSSLLSRHRGRDKVVLADKFAKGSQRDLGQVLANGGLGALLAAGFAAYPHPLWLAAYVGAMGAVNADTWATEIGVLDPEKPRLITTGRPVAVGTSGGVSKLGLMATLAGGGCIGLLSGLLRLAIGDQIGQALLLAMGGLLGGLAGSLFDSLLGATVQGIYYCDRCLKETEQNQHHCGTQTRLLRGYRWLGNDLVNLLSSAVGAVVTAGLVAWLW